MIAGLDGHLISEQFLETHLRAQAEDPRCAAFQAALLAWRQSQAQLGPASSLRTVFERGAAPLMRALGFAVVDLTRVSAGGQLVTSLPGPTTAVVLIVASYAEPLDPLWRVVVTEAASRGADWSLVFNGTHLRLLQTVRTASRRFTDFDLDAAADDELSGRALWAMVRAEALLGSPGTGIAARLIADSDRHGTEVCRSLRHGVLEASAQVINAFAERAPGAGADDLFAQSLTIVYRLLFLCFAEARALVPTWHPIYRDSYSVEGLCQLALNPATRGLWETVRAMSRLAHMGCRAGDLRVTAYNGRLFAPSRTPLAELPHLTEKAAREMLVALSTRPARDGEGREPIAYRDLGVEQLGAVYETLLDYRPEVTRTPGRRRATGRVVVALRPGGDVRKSTGSFYTPEAIVRYLVRRTLGPLVRGQAPERILSLRVLDPSMGSGAFLVGACRYLADAYADALVEHGACHHADLGPDQRAAIRRLMAERCLYGVDLNPMAVQLAQLSLWLATLSAEKPLGFLDHHLVAGNSLLGAWLSSLKRPPVARAAGRDLPLFSDEPMLPVLRFALPIRFSLATAPTDTLTQVRAKERALAGLSGSDTALSRWKRIADLWVARWFMDGGQRLADVFASLSDEVLHGNGPLASHLARPLIDRAQAAASAHRAFHWELEFPEVFFDETGAKRVDAGFDAVIGNPPWEMLRNDRGRRDAHDTGAAAGLVRFARESGVYRTRGSGHANCYQLFLERSLALLRPGGRFGMVLPSGLASDQGSAALRRLLFSTCRVESLIGFDNRRAIFPIHRGVRFLLLSGQTAAAERTTSCRFGEVDADVLDAACDEHGTEPPEWAQWQLSSRSLDRLSGPELTIPDFRTSMDVSIAERIASRCRPLGATDGWRARFGRELNATEDRDCFVGVRRGTFPIVEGKHLEPFAVRTDRAQVALSPADAAQRLGDRHLRPRLAYRDVASATNRLTLIAAILPARVASTHTILSLKTALPPRAQWFLCGLFNSLVLNYLVRQRVTTHVTTAIVEQLPVPTRQEAATAFAAIAARAQSLSRAWTAAGWADLQGRVARLYGLTDGEFAHIAATFPLLDRAEREAAVRCFSSARSGPSID